VHAAVGYKWWPCHRAIIADIVPRRRPALFSFEPVVAVVKWYLLPITGRSAVTLSRLSRCACLRVAVTVGHSSTSSAPAHAHKSDKLRGRAEQCCAGRRHLPAAASAAVRVWTGERYTELCTVCLPPSPRSVSQFSSCSSLHVFTTVPWHIIHCSSLLAVWRAVGRLRYSSYSSVNLGVVT